MSSLCLRLRLPLTTLRPLRQRWLRRRSEQLISQSPERLSISALRPSALRHHSTRPPTGNDSSVNASEVSHFTSLASSWWDPHGPSRLLHLMNPLRHDFIRSCLATSGSTSAADKAAVRDKSELVLDKNYAYLDIGCGGGIFASSAARLPNTLTVTAIDPTPDVIRVAEEHKRTDPLLSQAGRLNYVNCAIEELASNAEYVPTGGFDFVTVFEVIEHIDKPAAFLRSALEHLTPGGWLIGSTIARHPASFFTTKLVAEAPWPIGVVPKGTHDWNKYINPSELEGWFEKENRAARQHGDEDVYGTVRIEGCVYLPILGWKFVNGSQDIGNYFFGVQKLR